ncbi:MAG: hypothetical protein QNJ97_26245 [Myxococcota bacterium]|nr:hypothetical protein [Myxococcota bacterium]
MAAKGYERRQRLLFGVIGENAHRIAIRTAEVMFASDATWYPLDRSGGAWHLMDHPTPAENDTILLRLTSAQGEIVETTEPIPFFDPSETVFDTGVQLTDQDGESTSTCVFTPPMTVYDDAWGGIDQVRWMPNRDPSEGQT